MKRKILKPESYVEQIKIVKIIGQGNFSDVYYAKNESEENFALKIERNDVNHKCLENEFRILESVTKMSNRFPKVFKKGETDIFLYSIFELLGPSLLRMQKECPMKKFNLSNGLRLAIEMLRCIEDLHHAFYIHRDIKLSNFLIRASKSRPIALIDCGFGRKYMSEGSHIPPRTDCGFVGTLKYASINAHKNRDLSRRDDLMSWFYSILELLTGELPWSQLSKKSDVYSAKKNFDIESYCSGLPSQMITIYEDLRLLEYDSEPNYGRIIGLLMGAISDSKAKWTDPYEWEVMTPSQVSAFSPIDLTPPIDDKPDVPNVKPIGQTNKGCCYLI